MKKKSFIYYFIICFVGVTMFGCKNDKFPIEPLPLLVSFQDDVQPIFNNNCIICHDGSGIIAPDNFKEGFSYDQIMSKSLVIPGNLEASNMYQRITGATILMPPGSPLQQNQIDVIGQWILEGALNN